MRERKREAFAATTRAVDTSHVRQGRAIERRAIARIAENRDNASLDPVFVVIDYSPYDSSAFSSTTTNPFQSVSVFVIDTADLNGVI